MSELVSYSFTQKSHDIKLQQGIFLVEGAKRAALYDTTRGNVKNQELEEILQSQTVKETWELTKDKVLVCKDCEYRYACFDCRPLAADSSCGKNYSSAPAPRCTYNPYSGEWGSGIWRMNNHGEIIYEKLQIQN